MIEQDSVPAVDRRAASVLRLVLAHQRRTRDAACTGAVCARCLDRHLGTVRALVAADRRIDLVLPAFPVKSPNPAKVLGVLPDLAEEHALRFLRSLADRIGELHPAGARVLICSDGRVFSDLIGVSDEVVSAYRAELDRMIARVGGGRLGQFCLDDVAAGRSPEEMRAELVRRYGQPVERIRAEVRAGGPLLGMYRGITRFLVEDQSVPGRTESRAALQRRCRERAYGVISRSNAWSNLLAEHFPDAVRLSIHPQPCGSAKLGVLLADTSDTWLTPWHSVAVQDGARIRLMKRADAEAAGATPVLVDGRPTHYRLPARR